MPAPTQRPHSELDRLLADLDEGVYDGQLPEPAASTSELARPQRFSELKPFDVKAWAERKGIKLPEA